MSRAEQPMALTIAGSDSSGGAGVQADLKTFAALGVYGTTAITCLTAQNPRSVKGVRPTPAAFVLQQIDAVFAELPPDAVKTGMLFNAAIMRAVADRFGRRGDPPLVVDPVMIASSGARLLQSSAIQVLQTHLIPRAAVVTPNLDEAEVLAGRRIRSVDDLREAALAIHLRFGCAALVKGGHLRRAGAATDVFFDGETEVLLSAPLVRGVKTHGTGCTYSAAIAGYLALGLSLPGAVELAKNHITLAIAQSVRVGRHTALNPFWTG
jgi:hydroxymethylpyrimidine/phosphomethylpyrimidine kinase